jgi:hypothetical protein
LEVKGKNVGGARARAMVSPPFDGWWLCKEICHRGIFLTIVLSMLTPSFYHYLYPVIDKGCTGTVGTASLLFMNKL